MAKKFIQKATKNAHGQFREKAEKAGMSTAEYAKKEEDAPGKLGKQARLAETLMRLGHHRSSKENQTAMYGKEKE